jgi:hypothetical protein
MNPRNFPGDGGRLYPEDAPIVSDPAGSYSLPSIVDYLASRIYVKTPELVATVWSFWNHIYSSKMVLTRVPTHMMFVTDVPTMRAIRLSGQSVDSSYSSEQGLGDGTVNKEVREPTQKKNFSDNEKLTF